MVAFKPPESPRRRARSREVDSLSLDGEDIDSIKKALNSMFEAALALDTFLAGEGGEPGGEQVENDDSSFASEERRLRESETELSRALDSIENPNGDETSVNSDEFEGFERQDAFSAESYESPETQVPLLQPVSPFGSPFSESSLTPSKRDTANSLVLEAPKVVIHSPNDSPRKRQVRPYGLRKRAEEPSFLDLEASFEKVDSPRRHGSAQLMANALFGRTEYDVRPLFSSQECKRTVQGTVSVLLSSGIVVADHVQSLPLIWVYLFPILVASVQAKLPHRTDETIIAVIIFGTHVAISYLSTLYVV